MIYQAKKYVKACLVSLAVVAISLPITLLAAVAPVVTTLPSLHSVGAPDRMVIAADGTIYVSSYNNGAISQLDPTGKYIRTFNQSKIQFRALGLAKDGTLLGLTETELLRFSPDGVVAGKVDKTFFNASAMTVDDLGFIYVLESGTGKISIISPDYQFIKSFGSYGAADGQMASPVGIVFEKVSRQLIVADRFNQRIDFFDLNGNFIKKVGYVQTAMGRPIIPGEFYYVQDVTVEYTKTNPQLLNRIYVADSMNIIQVFDENANPILFPGSTNNFIGSVGYGDGQYAMPTGIYFDQANSRLFVTHNEGIAVFGIDGGSNPVDTTAPLLTIDPLLPTVKSSSVVVSGTVESGSSVFVASAATVAPVTYPTPTTWQTTVSSLTPGLNTITVTAKDAANNSSAPQSVSVTYTLPAPTLALTSTIPSITNFASLQLSGTVDAGSTVNVKNSANQSEGAAVVNGTTWTYSVALAEGLNNLTVSAQGSNTEAATKEFSVTLDSVPPVLAVSALSNNSLTSVQVQNISGTLTDAGQVSVLVNNTPVDIIAGAFSTAVTLADGENQINVIASDAAGNTVQNIRTILYDGTAPVINVADATLPDNATTASAVYSISGTVSEASKLTVAGVEVPLDSANGWNSSLNLTPGTNTIEVVATDAAGNSSSLKRTVTYSEAKIDLAITTPAQDFTTNPRPVLFAGKVSNSEGISVSYSVNGARSIPALVKRGHYLFLVDFKKAGTYSVAVTAKDLSGLETTSVRTVIVEKKKKDHRK